MERAREKDTGRVWSLEKHRVSQCSLLPVRGHTKKEKRAVSAVFLPSVQVSY